MLRTLTATTILNVLLASSVSVIPFPVYGPQSVSAEEEPSLSNLPAHLNLKARGLLQGIWGEVLESREILPTDTEAENERTSSSEEALGEEEVESLHEQDSNVTQEDTDASSSNEVPAVPDINLELPEILPVTEVPENVRSRTNEAGAESTQQEDSETAPSDTTDTPAQGYAPSALAQPTSDNTYSRAATPIDLLRRALNTLLDRPHGRTFRGEDPPQPPSFTTGEEEKVLSAAVEINQTCGNGIIEEGEQCDDGNLVNGDGCNDQCQTTVECSDGVDNDDAEDIFVDSADPGCHTDGNALNPASYDAADDDEGHTPGCQNGVVEGSEQCDDGNGSNNDACLNSCLNASCGDSFTETGVEECDDGNTSSGDGCSGQCIIESTLSVIKETQGGDGTFDFTGDLGSFSITTASGVGMQAFSVEPGSYSVDEIVPEEWVLVSNGCENVEVTAATSVSCTIVNAKKGRIIIVKETLPDGDPTSFEFIASYDGDGFSLSNEQSNDSGLLAPGEYNVAESTPAGWDTVASCSDGSPLSSIDLDPGETITCTFTNTKRPRLIVTKIVVNDHGGTKEVANFPLFVSAIPVPSGVTNEFQPGSYTVSETTDPGYASTITGDCAFDGTITLNPGDEKECTITNDDIQPKLIVIKHVVNDDGGGAIASQFTIEVTGQNVAPATFTGAETPGVTVALDAGAYDADETAGPAGYVKSLSTDCSGILQPGAVKTCTITNDDGEGVAFCFGIAPTITGTEGRDVLNGTSGPDVIHGLGGNDLLRGLGEDDILCGGDGDDLLIGHDGNDQLDGGRGGDVLIGLGESEEAQGGEDDDVLVGGPGIDTLDGGPGKDTCLESEDVKTGCEAFTSPPFVLPL